MNRGTEYARLWYNSVDLGPMYVLGYTPGGSNVNRGPVCDVDTGPACAANADGKEGTTSGSVVSGSSSELDSSLQIEAMQL